MVNFLDIVIVNWNGGDLFIKTIHSLLSIDNFEFINKIFIVDNNSSDGSIERIPQHDKIHIILNDQNRGFGAACNQAIRLSNSPYFLLLNPDVQLRKDTITKSLVFLEENNEVDILGVQQLDDFGNYVKSCSRFPTIFRSITNALGLHKILPNIFKDNILMTDYDYTKSGFVNQVMGAYMMIRANAVFAKVGIFDEQFFVYFEELDLSKRLADKGGKTFYNSNIQIIHTGCGTTEQIKAKRLYYNLSSKLKYNKKHFSTLGALIANSCVYSLELISRLLLSMLRRDWSGAQEILTAYKYLITKKDSSK